MSVQLTPKAAMDEVLMKGLFAAENCPHPRRWTGVPSEVYPWHGHGYHKILFVVSGSITFEDEERKTYRLTPGDRLDIEPGTLHSATAGPEGVECMESYR
jgi:quercetin dioxygenase-like cupin family protein